MLRFALRLTALASAALISGCSDIGSDPCASADCRTPRFADPEPATGQLDLGCITDGGPDIYVFTWDLFVDPRPIIANETFAVDLGGLVRVGDRATNDALSLIPDGFRRANVTDLRATVLVRDGVSASSKRRVVLRAATGSETCAYDARGNAGPNAGPTFPSCSPENDIAEGGNTDCVGLGGGPDARNPCGLFIDTNLSEDEDECIARGRIEQWVSSGLCAVGDATIPLETRQEAFVASSTGHVTFGWDDEATSAMLDTTEPSDPIWKLTPPRPGDLGPTSLRVRVRYDLVPGGLGFAVDCTMAEGNRSVLRPVDPADLIRFRIEEP